MGAPLAMRRNSHDASKKKKRQSRLDKYLPNYMGSEDVEGGPSGDSEDEYYGDNEVVGSAQAPIRMKSKKDADGHERPVIEADPAFSTKATLLVVPAMCLYVAYVVWVTVSLA